MCRKGSCTPYGYDAPQHRQLFHPPCDRAGYRRGDLANADGHAVVLAAGRGEHPSQRLAVHNYDVIAHIESLLSKLQDAETSQRAYLLTGSEEYLDPYQEALREAPSSNRTVSSLQSGAVSPGADSVGSGSATQSD